MKPRSQRSARDRDVRSRAVRRVANEPLLRGSLVQMYRTCGKEGCHCQQGEKHGPYYVLSSRSAGKGAFVYLDGERVDEVKDLVKHSRAFRQGLTRLRKLNQELVVALKSYQKLTARTGVRRLGNLVSARSQ